MRSLWSRLSSIGWKIIQHSVLLQLCRCASADSLLSLTVNYVCIFMSPTPQATVFPAIKDKMVRIRNLFESLLSETCRHRSKQHDD